MEERLNHFLCAISQFMDIAARKFNAFSAFVSCLSLSFVWFHSFVFCECV